MAAATGKNAVQAKQEEVESLREQVRLARTAAAATDPKQVEAAQLAALEREATGLRVELANAKTAEQLVAAGTDGKALTGAQVLKLATDAHKAAGLKVEPDAPMGQVPASENPALDDNKKKEQ